MTNKISQNRKQKEEIVKKLSEKAAKAKSIIFTNYQGLTHQQLERLKKAAKKLEAEYVTTKNTLLKKALGDKIEAEKEKLIEPTATLFIYNEISGPLKELTKIIKELNLPKIKFGILEGKTITGEEVVKIAALPSISVHRAKLLGQMKAPISGLHRSLNWNLQKFVMTLNAIKDKKG